MTGSKARTREVLVVILTGGLTALAFPKFHLSFLAWISLIPLLFILLKKRPRTAFLLGWLAGTAFYAVLLYWIPSVPAHYGNMSLFLSILVYIFLVVLLAVLWAFFFFVMNIIQRPFPRLSFFLAPFVWVSFEYILTYALTGFPWGILGYTQYQNIYFIQMAAVTGVYGISFVLVLFQSMFVYSISSRKRSPFLAALGLLLVIHLGGFVRLKTSRPPDEKPIRVSVIQGNVSSDIHWDRVTRDFIDDLFEQHLELSRQAQMKGARLIIWPEFSVPLCFGCPEEMYTDFKERLYQFVRDTGCTLLLGSIETSGQPGDIRYHNTALCLGPDFSISQYHKMHLVPFGEYTPYKKIFFFIDKVTHAIGEITPGTRHILHTFDGLKFGSPICYEIIFPDLVRKFVKKGGNFLVTITNDGWYGKSSAPFQHFSNAVLRAVENGRHVLRAATTGISGFIDPYGRIISKTELMTQIFLVEDVTPFRKLTIYTRFGDILPLAGLTLSLIFLILGLFKRRHERKRLTP